MLHFLIHLLHLYLPHIMLAGTAAVIIPDAGAAVAGNGEPGGPEGEGAEVSSEAETSDEGGEITPSEEPEAEEPQTPPSGKEKTEVDWRTVPPEIKAHLGEIAKTNPKLANMLQNAVYTSSSFLKAVPGGLKEITQLKRDIDSLGGIQEMRTMAETHKNLVDEQEALDNRARSGDPGVLDTLIEVSGPEGFSKLMPTAMSRWAAADKAGYLYTISQVMVDSMRQSGFVSDLNLAFKMLKLNNPAATAEAVECLNRCANWANEVNKVATTVPEKPKVDPQIESQQRDIEQQRTRLFNDKFSADFGDWRVRQINNELSSLLNGRQLNDYQRNTLHQRIVEDIKDILVADTDYMKSLQRLYDARDMAELQKFTRARTLKLLPEVSKKAFKFLFSGSTPPKKTPAKAASANGQAPLAAVPNTKTWTKIDPSKAPAPDQIDDKRTPFEMKFRKQAILKNGTMVYWGDKVPK